MKKNKLEIEYSYDFDLLGLTSSARSYKLAWELNQVLHIRLQKKPDLIIPTKTKEEAAYSVHLHQTAQNTLRLFRNRPNEPGLAKYLLIPEYPHVDFIIMIEGEQLQRAHLQEELRTISSIEWVAFIPLQALKSKDNFIF